MSISSGKLNPVCNEFGVDGFGGNLDEDILLLRADYFDLLDACDSLGLGLISCSLIDPLADPYCDVWIEACELLRDSFLEAMLLRICSLSFR